MQNQCGDICDEGPPHPAGMCNRVTTERAKLNIATLLAYSYSQAFSRDCHIGPAT